MCVTRAEIRFSRAHASFTRAARRCHDEQGDVLLRQSSRRATRRRFNFVLMAARERRRLLDAFVFSAFIFSCTFVYEIQLDV